MCQQCKDRIATLEQIAADRLEMIGGLGADLSRLQIATGELQTENARLRRIVVDVEAYCAVTANA